MNKQRIVAVIPMRGGSKSIPLKNLYPLSGHPLCYWTIKAAQNCDLIDEVWVCTDSPNIKKIAQNMKVNVLDEPKELAKDNKLTTSVLLYFMKHVEFDVLVDVHATSPLTTSKDLKNALNMFKKEKYDSLLTGVPWKGFLWNYDFTPFNYDYKHRPRRQDYKGWIKENGAFYITKRSTLEKYADMLGGKIGIYQMDPEDDIQIDEPSDLLLLENMIKTRIITLG